MVAGFAHVDAADPCPCGSGATFDGCCGPALSGTPPPTAQALMRSRYTAFVVGDAHYLRESWHPGTRPDDIALDPALEWRGLDIVEVQAGDGDDARGAVEFRARWREGSDEGMLSERSRFVKQSGRWWYLDGKVHGEAE
jgi:SEC-C motif domain protein